MAGGGSPVAAIGCRVCSHSSRDHKSGGGAAARGNPTAGTRHCCRYPLTGGPLDAGRGLNGSGARIVELVIGQTRRSITQHIISGYWSRLGAAGTGRLVRGLPAFRVEADRLGKPAEIVRSLT